MALLDYGYDLSCSLSVLPAVGRVDPGYPWGCVQATTTFVQSRISKVASVNYPYILSGSSLTVYIHCKYIAFNADPTPTLVPQWARKGVKAGSLVDENREKRHIAT